MKRVALACLLLGLTACSQPTLHGISGQSGDAEAALDNGVRRLLDQSTVGFHYFVSTSEDDYAVTMSGTVDFERHAWAAKGRVDTVVAGSAEDFELRSFGRGRWLGIAGPRGVVPCWVPIAEDLELEGLPAIDAGLPGFLMVMEHLEGVDWQLGEESRLTARLSLQEAALLASTITLTPSELAPPDGALGVVPVTVGIENGTLRDLLMTGSELVAAYQAAGAPVGEEAASDLESRDVRLTFGEPTLSVRRPDPGKVFDGLRRLAGCPDPEPESDV